MPTTDFQYHIVHDDVTINAFIGSNTDVAVPAAIVGRSVTVIGDNAFNNEPDITTMTLPASVHTIGRQAFVYCEKLTAVYGAENVIRYGYFAFLNCSRLTDITINPNSIALDYGAFKGCPLPEQVFSLPADSPLLTTYGYGASLSMYFFDVQNGEATLTDAHCGLESGTWQAVIPDTYQGAPVTAIGPFALSDSMLSAVQWPESIRFIGDHAFLGCSKLVGTFDLAGITLGAGASWCMFPTARKALATISSCTAPSIPAALT